MKRRGVNASVECEHEFSHEHKFSLSYTVDSLSLFLLVFPQTKRIFLNIIDGVRLAASSFVFDDGGKIRYFKEEKGSKLN